MRSTLSRTCLYLIFLSIFCHELFAQTCAELYLKDHIGGFFSHTRTINKKISKLLEAATLLSDRDHLNAADEIQISLAKREIEIFAGEVEKVRPESKAGKIELQESLHYLNIEGGKIGFCITCYHCASGPKFRIFDWAAFITNGFYPDGKPRFEREIESIKNEGQRLRDAKNAREQKDSETWR